MIRLYLALIIFAAPWIVNTSGAADQDRAVSDLQAWFEANYDPSFVYTGRGDFTREPGYEFSPYHIIPRWEEACLVPSTGKKKSEVRWEVPVITERRVRMSYRFRDNPSKVVKSREMDYRLVISIGQEEVQAYLLAERPAPESTGDKFSGVRMELDINTGFILNYGYWDKGHLIFYRAFDEARGASGGNTYYQDANLSYVKLPDSFYYMGYAKQPEEMVKMNAKLSSFHRRASACPIEIRFSDSANPLYPKYLLIESPESENTNNNI